MCRSHTDTRWPDRCGWRMLTGDEVGALLAWHLIARGAQRHFRRLDRFVFADGSRSRSRPISRTSRP